MIPEVAVAMLACARIGAPHNVVFGGFSPDSVKERMQFSEAKALITADGARRKGKTAEIKPAVDAFLGDVPSIETVVVVRNTGTDVEMKEGRDVYYDEAIEAADAECEAEPLDAEHPLFILYTSGSTAKPKGILHTTGGYLTGVDGDHARWSSTCKPDEDVYWCSADVGWVTGHSYIVYGPLLNGATSVMYEGAPDYPDKDIWWELCERYGVTIFYTAPTAIRACMKWGAEYPDKHDLSEAAAARHGRRADQPQGLALVPAGDRRRRAARSSTPGGRPRPGDIMITTLPGAQAAKPGSAGKPLPGIEAAVVDEDGNELTDEQGVLVLRKPWPGMLRTLFKEAGPLRRDLLRALRQGDLPGRRRRPQGLRRLLLGDRPDRRRDQRLRPPALDRRGRVGDRLAPEGGRGRRDRSERRGHRPGDLRLRDARRATTTRAPTSSRPRSASTSRRGSASSRARSGSSGPTTCRRPAPARSCAACCATSARAASSAT